MESKEVYNNGASSLRVEFDGEIVAIIQESEGLETQSIYLYKDELEKIWEFIETKESHDFGYIE